MKYSNKLKPLLKHLTVTEHDFSYYVALYLQKTGL